MGLTSAAFSRLAAAVDTAARDLFPCVLTIAGVPIAAAGPGGAEASRFVDGGEDFIQADFRFRLPAGTQVALGDSIGWTVAGREIALEVTQIDLRPADPGIPIRARIRRA